MSTIVQQECVGTLTLTGVRYAARYAAVGLNPLLVVSSGIGSIFESISSNKDYIGLLLLCPITEPIDS